MSRIDRVPHDRAADAAAYAVGALAGEEAQAYRRHLDRCAQCREELAAFQRVADALPTVVPQYPAPPGLRRRVMRAVRSDSRRQRHAARWPLAAAACVAAVAALIVAVGLIPPGSGVPRVLSAKVVSSPGTAQLRISGGHAELIVRHLPSPGAGRVYEVWLRRGTRAPAPTTALFSVTARGAADVGVPGELDGVSQILVTQEPVGGSRVPTGRAVIVAATS